MLSRAQFQSTGDQPGVMTVLQPGATQLSPASCNEAALLQMHASSLPLVAGPLALGPVQHVAGMHERQQHAELGTAPEDC